MLTDKAYAKINLTLDVINKRPDGYHELETVMRTISLYDTVSVEKADKIILTCSEPGVPLDEKNTCHKAAEVFFKDTGILGGAKIIIEKNIPSEAGLGGGSSDAAAVLRLLNELYDAGLSRYELEKSAVKVGADVPFLIEGGAAVCRGIGENIERIFLPEKHILLVKPGFGISTPEAYRIFDEKNMKSARGTEKFKEALKIGLNPFLNLSNDLGAAIENSCIASLKTRMLNLGAEAAEMTGSGSCVYGVFNSEAHALIASKYFREPFVKICVTI